MPSTYNLIPASAHVKGRYGSVDNGGVGDYVGGGGVGMNRRSFFKLIGAIGVGSVALDRSAFSTPTAPPMLPPSAARVDLLKSNVVQINGQWIDVIECTVYETMPREFDLGIRTPTPPQVAYRLELTTPNHQPIHVTGWPHDIRISYQYCYLEGRVIPTAVISQSPTSTYTEWILQNPCWCSK